MINLIKSEFYKLRNPYILTIVVGMILGLIMIYNASSGYDLFHSIELWELSLEIFVLLFPLFSVIPTMWLLYYERKNNFILYTITRVSKRKYIVSKWLISSLAGASIVFFISFFTLIVTLFLVPDVQGLGTDTAINQFAGYYFVHEPFTYGIILSLWRMVIAFLIASLGFVLSMYVKNIFLVLTGPFVYLMMENFLLAILGTPYYGLVASFEPHSLSPSAITVVRLLFGPIILIIVTILIFLFFKFIKKKSIYEF